MRELKDRSRSTTDLTFYRAIQDCGPPPRFRDTFIRITEFCSNQFSLWWGNNWARLSQTTEKCISLFLCDPQARPRDDPLHPLDSSHSCIASFQTFHLPFFTMDDKMTATPWGMLAIEYRFIVRYPRSPKGTLNPLLTLHRHTGIILRTTTRPAVTKAGR